MAPSGVSAENKKSVVKSTEIKSDKIKSKKIQPVKQTTDADKSQNQQTINNQNTQINQNQTIINQNNATQDLIKDESSPNMNGLANSAGWLPPGPVDSILNLPLTFLQSLYNALSGSCSPVRLPVPYINYIFELPCISTIYDGFGITALWNSIGLIASGFILYSYLTKLYKWVDDTLTFRENNHIDNWGGI